VHAVAVAIFVLWIAFWIYWLAVATTGVRAVRVRWGRFAGFRIAVILLLLLLIRTRTIKGQTITSDPALEAIGLLVFLAGLALAIWARRYLGQNWGMPMSEKVDPELVTTGPYSRVRHPIYSGIILAMIGTAIAVSWYWLLAAMLAGAYFAYSAVMEERYMAGLFPDTYPAYKRSTNMLVPFVL
jgi:isoprenylcysteine carboxyl methyltransferase (ICMT) family protein YpbQ